MTSQQTQTGNNFIMPIILTLISAFVITDTLSTDDDKNLEDNVAVVQQETTEMVSNEHAITEEKVVVNENLAAQSIASAELAQATDITATDIDTTALDLNAENIALTGDSTATIIKQAEDATEITEPGVTSSTTALAENVALEIFEINTTAATEETQEGATGQYTQVRRKTTTQRLKQQLKKRPLKN